MSESKGKRNSCPTCGYTELPPPDVPAPYSFLHIRNEWAFPFYGASGGLTTHSICVLVHSRNESFERMDLGQPGINHSDAGLWATLKVMQNGEVENLQSAIVLMDDLSSRQFSESVRIPYRTPVDSNA
jgi:hypothetical protein